jgi:predicted nucleic acid-binding protein
MIVVADTGPLRYLVEIEADSALSALYGRVLTTPEVLNELSADHFPETVKAWGLRPPAWLDVAAPSQIRFAEEIDIGEASALSIAVERSADLVLIDERDGNAIARSQGLNTLGTLGVIREAGARGHLDFDSAMRRLLNQTRFRHTPRLIEENQERYIRLCQELQHQRGVGRHE